MKNQAYVVGAILLGFIVSGLSSRILENPSGTGEAPVVVTISDVVQVRIATFNIALNRKAAGELVTELKTGTTDSICQIAEVIQRVRPDVILLCELDHDVNGDSMRLFRERYLEVSQNGQEPIEYAFAYTGPVNTGVLSGVDVNQDGKIALPDDGFGFGQFAGQYGMAVLSRYPIVDEQIRTFQQFLWKDMPNHIVPVNEEGEPFYPGAVFSKLRLSSKSHWDIPVRIDGQTIHLLCSHPTPPVFDGPEDRNGCRNHDEIRFWADYVAGDDRAAYLKDDLGKSGGLDANARFVVLGDLNADPFDGDSRDGAVRQLTGHPLINGDVIPSSSGAVQAAAQSAEANATHEGNPAHDTGDFDDRYTGNLRIDYCLPSRNLELQGSGVFWPAADEPGSHLNGASDHHLVWIDVQIN